MYHCSDQCEGECFCAYKIRHPATSNACKVNTLKISTALQYSVGSDYDPEIQSSFTSSITPFLLTDSTSATFTKLQRHVTELETPKEMQGRIAIPSPNKPQTAFDCERCKGTMHTILDGKMCCGEFHLFKALSHLKWLQSHQDHAHAYAIAHCMCCICMPAGLPHHQTQCHLQGMTLAMR